MVGAAVMAAVWMPGLGSPPATAQMQLPDGRLAQQSRVQLVTDRTASRGIKRAQESIAAGEYSQAIQFLDGILAREQDLFVELGSDGGYGGLKETARQLIRDLPPAGRQAYEAAYGAAARRLLKAAVDDGDAAALQLVARRYFYTPAGYEAAFLLAMDEADAGRHLSAALNYQQLLESPEAIAKFDPHLSLRAAASWLAAGDEDRARSALEALTGRGQTTVQVAGKQHRLNSSGESLEWLAETVGGAGEEVESPAHDQWLTYRGNASRTSESAGGLPHMRVRWKVRLLGHPQLETLYENFAADLTRSGNLAPIASSPLAAGDYILTRTPHGLLAVDFRTGKRVWRSEPQREPELEALMRAGGATDEEAANPEPARSFARRLWEDYLYGLVSSDGARVYMIRDLPMPVAQDFEMSAFMGAPGIDEKRQTNRLSSYELATQGKLVWEVDGAAATGDLAGAFFLGAPLAVGESLYVLAEVKSGVYLVALDRETGEFQWRQALAELETGVLLDVRRRLQSAMPSYEAGILVCPTGAGVVVSVDLAKRSLAWAYRYETTIRPGPMYHGRDEDSTGALARRWQDGAATIVGDRVVLTPPESDQLHCVDLHSGRLLWKQPRGEMTRLASADSERILLIGNRKLRALRVADGKPAWRKDSLALPRGVLPSGTGFVSEGKYHLPLTSAEVIAINLADGRIESRAASRDGAPLGNLICHRGTVISQSGAYLDCFDQIDALRKRSEERLNQEPTDVEALRALGEIAYNEGRLSDAIALLERAYRSNADDVDVRDVLAECLAAALDEDFAAHRSRLSLLRELSDGGATRQMVILRIEARGLLEEGDVLASAAACLQLYRLAGPPDEMLDLGREHQAAVSRWVQAQLAAIWERADDEQRRDLETQLKREAEGLGENPDSDELARFLQFFGELPMFQSLKLARIRELKGRDQWLEAQQLLLDIENSGDEPAQGEAIARIASQLHEAGLHSLAAEYDRRLSGPLADVKLLNDMTGAQLVAQWNSLAAESVKKWPLGKVKATTTPTSGGAAAARVRSPLWGIRLERSDSILGLATAQLSARGGEIVVHDNLGREFFSANLEPESQFNYRQAETLYGVSRGNLLVVSLGKQLAAFNTFATTDGLAPPVLWRVNLGSNLDYSREYFAAPPGGPASRAGSYRAPRPMDEGKWVGVIGPVTSRGVVFQDQRRLVCADAMSGEVRWSRTDVPQGCDLFGDAEYVFAVPTGSTNARIYSTVDGRALGKCEVPPWRDQLVTRGGEIICWKISGDNQDKKATLSAMDALTGETAWTREFEPNAAVDVERGRYVLVVEPKGRVIVIDGADGKVLVDYAAAPKPAVDEVHLLAGQDDFLVVVKRPRRANADRMVRAFNMVDSPVIDGELMLFDRTSGETRWSRPAEVVQQALLLTQPADLPFIVFAGLLMRSDGGGSRNLTTMLILDKATGRTLYQSDDLPQSGGGHCLARVTDAASHQAAVEMAGQTILLQFTDERRPPEPPAMAEVESSAGKMSRGLMGILRSLGGR
jgi:outer membrane protein assembly factor BamB